MTLSKKPINPRKLLLDTLKSSIGHHTESKNILGGLLSIIGGSASYGSTGVNSKDEHDEIMVKEALLKDTGKSRMLILERGSVIHGIEHVLEDLENEMELAKTGALETIYRVSSTIQAMNKKQMETIHKYKRIYGL